jgi:elongation factor 3
MRNIANGNIDGLPDNLRTVYVEHDIVGSEANTPVLDFMAAVPELATVGKERIAATLSEVAFTAEMQAAPISSLSGGWKMKLALARAMLMEANVLLLDEPTNHLDTTAVAWLTRYLAGLSDVTVLVVSHDTQFLDNVVTDILHYEEQKLVPYHGNLSHFVRLRPEARSYYALEASTLRFKFPDPGPLDGINSTTKSILTMTNASFTYPGASTPNLIDASLKLCLASRVAVVGVNGAGKTTLIRLVVRESEPQSGEVWAHHNLRVAYVAQHSFHHVEQHLSKSPVQYLQWRYGAGDGTDREVAENNLAMKLTPEEEERLSKQGAVERIMGRRKTGRTLEYECSFVGLGDEYNRYITLEKLTEMGCTKLVQQADNRVAAQAAGLDSRPTTTREIQQHLDDFALAPEFSVHGKIGGLSGGQKVRASHSYFCNCYCL